MDHKKLWKVFSLLLALAPACLVFAPPAYSTEFRSGDAVHVADREILDDLFATGGDVNINANIIGDLFAVGRKVTVGDSAEIDNSVMAGGERVDINGRVRNSARLFGQYLTVRGHIERNLMAFSESLILDSSAWVEKDITAMCGEILIRGRVGGNIDGSGRTITISGQIDGDLDLEADQVVIQETAIIGGHLKYRSANEAKIEEGAQILGAVERLEHLEESSGYALGDFVWDAWWFLAAFAFGVMLLIMFRPFFDRTADGIRESLPRTFGLGFLFLVSLPVAAVVLALTLVGIPTAVLTLIGWLVLLYAAKLFVGLALGRMLLGNWQKSNSWGTFAALFVGLAIITVAVEIPYLGWPLRIVVYALGVGAFVMTAYQYRKQPVTA